jgi:hypothetical protein
MRCDNTQFQREVPTIWYHKLQDLNLNIRHMNLKSQVMISTIPYTIIICYYFISLDSVQVGLFNSVEVQAHHWPNTASVLWQICTVKYSIIELYTPNNAESFLTVV